MTQGLGEELLLVAFLRRCFKETRVGVFCPVHYLGRAILLQFSAIGGELFCRILNLLLVVMMIAASPVTYLSVSRVWELY